MRPISEMPTGDVAGVFVDLDDTLTWRGSLVADAYGAVCALVDAGLHVLVATGRAGGWAEVLAELWPVAGVVAENGGYAVLRGGARHFWDDPQSRQEQRRRLAGIVRDAGEALPFARPAGDFDLRRVDVAFDLHEHADLDEEQVAALETLVRGHGARVVKSSIHLHAFYGDHDKPRMLARLAASQWGESESALKARYVYVGDSPNDQAAFAFFPRSAGVQNVERYAATLDPPPAFVAARPGGHGFVEIARAILDGKSRP
jgi:hydroxymethylpyrimidine pyrophosphatase-like HAD family hydrolase